MGRLLKMGWKWCRMTDAERSNGVPAVFGGCERKVGCAEEKKQTGRELFQRQISLYFFHSSSMKAKRSSPTRTLFPRSLNITGE